MACGPDSKMEVVFGGDVMLDRGIRSEIDKNGLTSLLDDISPIFKSSDYGVVNLECPIGSLPTPLTKQFVFIGDPKTLPDLRQAGISHCIMANNHSYDHGREAMVKTANHLLDNSIIPVGYGKSQNAACEPVILEKGEIRVAVFASVTLGLEAWMYLENEPGMCQATIGDLQSAIKMYKKRKPEHLVIVTLHWGAEYQQYPMSLQRRQAKALIEAGADAIIGHHPHVVQSFESIMGKPVFYSIGNLVFDNQNPITHEGILVKLTIHENSRLNTTIIPYHTVKSKPIIMSENQKLFFMNQFQKHSNQLPK